MLCPMRFASMQYYEESCFLEQELVMDDSKKVKDFLKESAKELGVSLTLSGFVRVQCGEGLEDEGKKDFAAEVADTLGKTS